MDFLDALILGLGSLFCFHATKWELKEHKKLPRGGRIAGLVVSIIIAPAFISLVFRFEPHEILSVYAAFVVSALAGVLVSNSKGNGEE
jgi:hypothetical protein